MRVLVTGATGFIGRATTLALLEAGHAVRAFVRDPARAVLAFGERPVDVIAGDVRDGAHVRAALDGVDAVVHAAATYSYRRADTDLMLKDNPAIAEAVLGAAAAAGTSHVIDVSSGIVFKAHPNGPQAGSVDTASPYWDAGDRQWNDPYLRSKVLAEQVGRRFLADGLPLSTIHPGLVVGPFDRGPGVSGGVLVALLSNPGVDPEGRGTWIDVRDVAGAIVGALARPAGGRHLVAAHYLPFREMAATLDRLTGRHVRRLWLSPSSTRRGASLNDLTGGYLMRALPPRDSLEFVLTGAPVDGSSGEAALGRPYRAIEATLTDTLRWWAANGVIPRRWAGPLAV
ncbi:MAG: NAD-dependent epimerase/dehydratase family protein [Candidatus Limnocylindrales bacterium]